MQGFTHMPNKPRLQLWAGLALAIALGSPVAAQGMKASSAPEFARRIDTLKPGEWVWAPQVAPAGPVLIYVDLSKQIAVVYRNGVRIAATTVSTGKPGHETPTGVFTILQKDAKHRSSTYNNAPMPYQQRLTWDGVALHAGGLPGYPESHGCVHLPMAFSRELFAITNLGMTVVIQGDAISHTATSANTLLAPFDAKGAPAPRRPLEGDEQFRWNPALAPAGPLSIIVSKTDQRIVVLRDGVEIGRARATVADDDPGSHVITLVSRGGRTAWVYVGMTAHEADEGRTPDEATLNRVHMPRAFYDALRKELRVGSTVLVTNSGVGALPLQRITVLNAVAPDATTTVD